MVESVIKHFEGQLKAAMPFLERIDLPVYQAENGQIYKGHGSEKEQVSINDQTGVGLYIRQTLKETASPGKQFSSCDREFNFSAPCRAVFYCFGEKAFTMIPDDIKSKLMYALAKMMFLGYKGTEYNISVQLRAVSTDIEAIFKEETKLKFSGNEWPVIAAVDFNLLYSDFNCEPCLTEIPCE